MGGEGHTSRAPSASHQYRPYAGEGGPKQEVGGGGGVRVAAGPAPGQGFQLEKRRGK